jgi:hypothetical protein
MDDWTVLLVFALHAVLLPVANVFLADAVVLTALTLGNDLRWTRELAFVALHVAVLLVFAFLAVGRAVAFPLFRDATGILARVLVVRALTLTVANVAAVLLVLARVAILFLVATPTQRNASSVVAFELVGSAALGLLGAIVLVDGKRAQAS